jgi:hypothetical protein
MQKEFEFNAWFRFSDLKILSLLRVSQAFEFGNTRKIFLEKTPIEKNKRIEKKIIKNFDRKVNTEL